MLHDVNNNLEEEAKLFELQSANDCYADKINFEANLERDLDNALMKIQMNILAGRM